MKTTHTFLIGLLFDVALFGSVSGGTRPAPSDPLVRQRSASAFPILMYDSDIGFGFGGKGVVKNRFKKDESFDLILFGSTKGEQWYVFTFSIPDFEIRQGRRYPLALDLKLTYDKILKSNFFGFGNGTRDNPFQFPTEITKLELILGHAFSKSIIAEAGFRFSAFSAYGFDPAWGTIASTTPGAGQSRISSLNAGFRWDTRDSQIHPHRGWRLNWSLEKALKSSVSDWDFLKIRMETSAYASLWKNHVLAGRFWTQHVSGNVPYSEMSKIGDSWTARGYKADRFLDRAMALTSLEYRFPVYRKIGGVAFTDAGRVWPGIQKFGFTDWHGNWGMGLRYYLENFVVRLDIGKSPEGTRMFFMFGQVF